MKKEEAVKTHPDQQKPDPWVTWCKRVFWTNKVLEVAPDLIAWAVTLLDRIDPISKAIM